MSLKEPPCAFCVHPGQAVLSRSGFLWSFFFSSLGEEREPALLDGIPRAGILKHSRTKVLSQLCGNGTLQ